MTLPWFIASVALLSLLTWRLVATNRRLSRLLAQYPDADIVDIERLRERRAARRHPSGRRL